MNTENICDTLDPYVIGGCPAIVSLSQLSDGMLMLYFLVGGFIAPRSCFTHLEMNCPFANKTQLEE